MNIQINTKESNRTDLAPLCFKNRRIDCCTLSQNHIIVRKLPQIFPQEFLVAIYVIIRMKHATEELPEKNEDD